jgi:prepilin-type N-terminal cleavage/methylation domain-containing protein
MRNRSDGFTIIELLIVIVVIGVLAGLVLNTFTGVQDDSKVAKSQSDLKQIDSAILALGVDVGKWPNGCTIGTIANPEVNVELVDAGLASVPTVGVIDSGCEWTAADVSRWNGPYLNAEDMFDAWNNSYVFDPDYTPYQNCSTETTLPEISVVATLGEDGVTYTCDDVYVELSGQ